MRKSLAMLPLLLVLLSGCTITQSRSAVRASGVEPLSEDDFDRFTSRLADDIAEVAKHQGYWPPAIITVPHVEPGSDENDTVARTFARRLSEGLNDRLSGAAFFTRSSIAVPDLRCTLLFAAGPDDPTSRRIIFRLFDYDSRRELLKVTYSYQFSPQITG